MSKTQNPYVHVENDGQWRITPEGKAYLAEAVTNTEGNVYSFYGKYNSTIIAAAMARLSRFGGDMRELILKEFADQDGQEEALLRRVLTQFGDDSVQQLGHVPVVIENASNLLTKQIEWGRLAAYLEQSTRYIYYDTKRDGKYRYFTPDYLPKSLQNKYQESLDSIFSIYSDVVHKMTDYYYATDKTPEAERDVPWRIAMRGKACDAARGLLPVATTSTVGVVGSAQAIDNMIMNLMSQDLPEAQRVGQQILDEVRKQHSIFFERTDLPNRGGAIIEHRKQTRTRLSTLVHKKMPTARHAVQPMGAKLLDYSMKNELDLLPHMLFAHTHTDFKTLQKEISGWSEADKTAVFDLYVGERGNRRHKPGRALEILHYTFELVCDYGAFRDLQRHRMVDALEWQSLTPYLGFDVPQAITDANLADTYNQAHKIAHELYNKLLQNGYALEAQYATLFDHKLRWKLTLNARAAFHFIELRTQPAGHIGYRKLAKLMHDEIAKVHPRLAEAMIFVNRNDDDPATSRLEQSRRAQKKLEALGLDGLIE